MTKKRPVHAIVLLGTIVGRALGEGAHPVCQCFRISGVRLSSLRHVALTLDRMALQLLRRAPKAEDTIVTCLALKRFTAFEPGSTRSEAEEAWDCELPGGSILTLDGLDELESPEIIEQFESGVSEIAIPGGVVAETSIIIPPTSRLKVDRIESSNANPKSAGNVFSQDDQGRRLIEGYRKVLVVRVTDQTGVSTTASANFLSDTLFDPSRPNFVSQFRDCSYGKLWFGPTTTLNEGDPVLTVRGVYDVTIPERVTGGSHHVIREAVTKQLRAQWKNTVLPARYKSRADKSSPFDHMFYCIPPGTTLPEKGWIAYGYEGGWLTVYNDDWCHMLSANVSFLGQAESFSRCY